ncbi:inositol monophosphatase family protein [Brucella cytisi]|uniref:inositol monophosphatase family protein n=1 Tax=Brucella cytisi TaxID=407152 RepID=UPI00313C867E
MSEQTLNQLAIFANELADIARHTIRSSKQADRRPIAKPDSSPVTNTDKTVELRLRERIAERFPDHGILGEEFGAGGLDREFVWVVDPIDGTKAFIGGLAIYGTLISLTRGGVPLIGLIDNPTTGDRWLGNQGKPTTLNGNPVQCASTRTLAEAFIANGNPDVFTGSDRVCVDNLREATRWCVYGGSCIAYGRVADGSLDISIDGGLSPYDYCALVPVINGAGGCITDWQGAGLGLASGDRCVASANPDLHRQVLDRLSS